MRPAAIYLLDSASFEVIYGPDERREIAALADFCAPPQTAASIRQNPELLADVEIIFSGWGAPKMDAAFLASAPKLRAVFYGAGSIRGFVTDAFWDRGILVTSAYAANAVPVAEYALGAILLSLKHFWRFAGLARKGLGWEPERPSLPPGAYRSAVGLISFGMVARKLNELLGAFDLDRLVACPFLRREEAGECGVELCALPELFRRADVVSLHTPDLPETRGMITGELIASMKPGAIFLNTARGAVVRQEEMIEVLLARPDLTAILDVTHPEPPEPDSPLLTLPNVVLTPHIAGSLGAECQRMGRYMAEELRRYLAGEPLRWAISREQAAKLA